MEATRRRLAAFGWGLATLSTAWLAWMALRPNPQVAEELQPISAGAWGLGISPALVIGFVGNIVVFVPLGIGLGVALGERIFLAIALGASVSLAIELLQLSMPSRVSSPIDFVLNTAGVAIGVLLIHFTFRKVWRKND